MVSPLEWLRGRRGEYWLIPQAVLFVGFFLLPHEPSWREALSPGLATLTWGAGLTMVVLGLLVSVAGLASMGTNLTPYPLPRSGAEMVQRGVYRWLRHPCYGGLIYAALGWSLASGSLPHLACSVVLWLFLDVKSRVEDRYLCRKFPAYDDYRRRVSRFVPGIY